MQTLKRKQSKTKLTKEEMLARFEEEKRFRSWSAQQLEGYATKMTGLTMNKGKLKKRGKMWHSGAKMTWTAMDEVLNSKQRYKNTGNNVGFKR